MADPSTQRDGEDMIEMITILAHPATSYWLRDAIVSAIERDPFDAERDALVLAELLGRRLDALVARHFPL
ncbi:hypothetical protein [Sphingomonas profundi]|uniref:hypothetical protein n=1 Tax=Alterirhizorhabdus profundi TaxID=2681549 RepID=UPI0012E7B3C6|nr:hypothetical protein [Sphingomonas profundi]